MLFLQGEVFFCSHSLFEIFFTLFFLKNIFLHPFPHRKPKEAVQHSLLFTQPLKSITDIDELHSACPVFALKT